MIRHAIATIALLVAAPCLAQSQQPELQSRYDRALAAGYKALFLCSAIANAERAGATRTVESVERWELSGIQAPLDQIVGSLPAEVIRDDEGFVDGVLVSWADDAPPRMAIHHVGNGCRSAPIGARPQGMRNALAGQVGQVTLSPADETIKPVAASPGLEGILGQALAGGYGDGSRTTAVLVLKDGDRAAESYAAGFGPETPQRTWSVAKSIAATLVGAAVQRGEADVTTSAGLGASGSDPRRTITLDHLLRMASGRYSDTAGNRTDPLYFGGSTVEETAAHWPLIEAPGSSFRYANNDTLMAVRAIKPTFTTHPPSEFFARLGMDHTVAETDWQGDYILSSQVWSTARDLARLGQLYLQDGVWDGERILPAGWIDYVSSPSGPQPDGPLGYGAGFWLFNDVEGVPSDTFAAIGNRGQYVVIVPERDLVIVRRGEDPAGSRFDIAAFTRDILANLE